jgi:putative ABC transport system substrate-binding protein
MRRRDFFKAVAGASAAWPFGAHAQQSSKRVVGFLGLTSPDAFAEQVVAFKQGLAETSFVDGQNVAIEYRWARGQFDQLSALAADLVQQRVNVCARHSSVRHCGQSSNRHNTNRVRHW